MHCLIYLMYKFPIPGSFLQRHEFSGVLQRAARSPHTAAS